MEETDQRPNVNQEATDNAKTARKSVRDRRVKVVFVVVFIVAAAVIFQWQRRGASLTDAWTSDLEAALTKGREENRLVALFIMAEAQNEATSRMIRKSLNHKIVRDQLGRTKPLTVAVVIESDLKGDLAGKYKVEELPTLIVFSPDGKILHRKRGYVGPAEVSRLLTPPKK